MRPAPCGCTSARLGTGEFAADFRENGVHCVGRCGHRPLQMFTKKRTGRTGQSTLQNTADEHSWSSIPQMSRSKTCCPLSATACGIFVGTINYWKSIGLAPEQGAEKHLRVSAINRFPAPLFAYFFWQGRKSGSAKQRLRPRRENGSPVNPDKRADVGIGPYKHLQKTNRADRGVRPYTRSCAGKKGIVSLVVRSLESLSV